MLYLDWLVLQSPPLVVDRVYVVVEMSINALVPLLRIEQARLGLRLRVSFVFVDQAGPRLSCRCRRRSSMRGDRSGGRE